MESKHNILMFVITGATFSFLPHRVKTVCYNENCPEWNQDFFARNLDNII